MCVLFNIFCYTYNMLKLTDALHDIIRGNALLQFGMTHGLFNLTKLAAHLQSLVVARTKKDVSTSAITMALSRMGRQVSQPVRDATDFHLDSLAVTSGLAVCTYPKSRTIHKAINRVYDTLVQQGRYITITESTSEITIILDRSELVRLERAVDGKPQNRNAHIAAVVGRFSADYTTAPGLIYHLVQQLELQGINIIEISSTFTEMIFYVDESEVPLAFETLHTRFMR